MLLNTPGDTTAAPRRRPEGPVPSRPSRLTSRKVARHAYTVTDGDIAALREAGYSEDAIFEITLSAAVGAGLARLERGLAVLRGES